MHRNQGGGARSNSPKKIFAGVRFVLFGFDSVSEAQYRFELVNRGGFDVGRYDSSCTHVIVSGRVFDEPVCVAARNDGKMLITELWIDDSLSFGMLADYTKVLYRPVRDLSGIPGSETLHICLTGYQRQERDDIMRMVSLMGGRFSKPLIANQVTHLVCYKFEGEKYELAKKVNIKLVNHRWLEDCLKAWDILPIDNYGQSGWELELLEAAAMDTDDEAVDVGNRVTVQRSITESHSLRGEISVNIGSGTLVDKINLGLKKDALAAKPGDPSVNSLLISTPHKINSSRNAIDICGIEDKAPNLNHHLECRVAERLSDNLDSAMINSKSKDTNLLDSNSKCNHLPSNVRSSLMNEISCEKDIKSSSPSYLRKITEKAVTFEVAPHIGPPEDLKIAGEARASYTESKDAATKACMYDSLQNSTSYLNKPQVDRKTQSLPKKRKLSGSKSSSKLIKIGQVSSNSFLLDASRSVSSEELDFLKPQQQEPESCFAHNESSVNICHMLKINDAFPQTEMLSISNACLRSPLLAQKDSGNCVKQSPSSSTNLGQIKSFNAHHHETDHDLTDSNGFEVFAHPRESEHGTLPKSGSLKYKRKFLKNWQPASAVNISSSSSSMPDNKDELLSIPSNSTLDETASPTHKPVSGVGTLYDIPIPKAIVLSDCPLNNEPEKTDDRRTINDLRILRPPSAGSGNVNEETIGVQLFETSLKSVVNSGSAVKSQNVDNISMKYNTDICNGASEHQEKLHEDHEDFRFELKGTKVKGSVSTEINGFCENGKDNKGSLHNNQKGRRPKKCRENRKNKHSSDSLKSTNLTKSAIKSGNGVVRLGNIDSLKENIEKEYSPMKEKGEVEQCHSLASNAIIDVLDENHLDPEKENKLMDSYNLIIKEDEDCGHMVKKICRSDLGIKCSRTDNIVSMPKLTNMGTAWFLLSGHRSQRVEFQKIIKRLRGKLCKDSHNWVYEATHFIVPDYVRRTQKFFAAAAAGRWILRSDYLTASNEAGKLLIEEPFEWHKNGLSEDGSISLEAPRKWRTLRERTCHGAFFKMRIIIYGECIAPSLDTLKRVVKAGDGTILATSPPYTRFLNSGIDYAIVSASMPPIDKWVQEFLRHEIPCVLPEYLVEYVCKPGYSLEKHVLYRTHTWERKSFENMVIRSSEVDYDQPSTGDDFVSLKCVVCGSPDREELMLICGDEAGALGCGVGTHIDCCDPPLSAVPEGDWFCSNCSRNMGQKKIIAKSTKLKRKKGNH